MIKTLDNDSFLKEMINNEVEIFPEIFSGMPFFNREFFKQEPKIPENQNAMYKILYDASLSLKDRTQKFFLHETKLPDSDYTLFIVSKNYIIKTTGRYFSVMDIHSNFLFIIRPYDFENDYFKFDFFKNIKRKPDFTMISNKFSLKIKNNNKFRIKSSLCLTGLLFKPDYIEALFSSKFPCSSIKLDYQYNILEAQLNNQLKNTLNININKKIQYDNIKNYSDLINKINLSIEENLDIYTLINDEKFKLRISESKFHRDLEYIKSITLKKEEMLKIRDLHEEDIIVCYNFYNKLFNIFNIDFSQVDYVINNKLQNTVFTNYKESDFSKIEFKKYKLLALLEVNKNGIIDEKILNTIMEISEKSKKIVDFNLRLSNLNQFKTN